MLGLYLYTLTISHKSCNMYTKKISIANGIANLCDKLCVIFDKNLKLKNKKSNIKTLAGARN